GAAIALIGLKFAFQTDGGEPYDTVPDESHSPAALATMDDLRAGDARVDDRQADQLPALDSTFELVERAKSGDDDALNQLFARYLPPLRRWASGRLPQWTRDLMDTDDLVQETVVRAVKRIDRFESRHEGALQAYLRQAVVNRIRDEVRRSSAALLRSRAGAASPRGARSDHRACRDGRKLSGGCRRSGQAVGRRRAH